MKNDKTSINNADPSVARNHEITSQTVEDAGLKRSTAPDQLELASMLTPPSPLEEAPYGSTISVAEALAVAGEQINIPQIDETYLYNVAVGKGPAGESDITDYHVRLFGQKNGEHMAKCRKLKSQIDMGMQGVGQQQKDTSHILKQTPRYLEQMQQSTPWTRFSKIEIGVLLMVSCALLAVGINTIAQVLMASGIRGFDNPWRCYVFSLIPIGLAFGLKYLRRSVPEQFRKRVYPTIIWTVGLFLGVLWALLFASIFPSITQSVDQIINSLSANSTVSESGTAVGIAFILISILAEACLAAGCWLTIEGIVEHHQSPIRIDNPAFKKVQSDVDFWTLRKYELQELSAKIEGKLHALDEAKHRFVAQAAGKFYALVYKHSPK